MISNSNLQVVVFGATGFTGGELLSLLAAHPLVSSIVATANDGPIGNAGEQLSSLWPRLFLSPSASKFKSIVHSTKEVLTSSDHVDAAFFCFPHGATVDLESLVHWGKKNNIRLFDVGDTFRHRALGGESGFAYGLPELFSEKIKSADLVACAGCYPTSVLLATGPLVRAGALDTLRPIIIDAKSGTTGAGRKPQTHLLLSEAANNLTPYKVGRLHRHVAEMEGALQQQSDQKIPQIIFSPHLLPIPRGLLSTIYTRLTHGFTAAMVRSCLSEFYAQSQFVHVLAKDKTADLSMVINSPHSVISVHGVEDDSSQDVVIISALDNLLKGAASQALQCFELAFERFK